ncbi:hypothetical protein Q3G72_033302 [Acer saccharum]|nr:hypothetical protein Q3G72_033302 [Acer saccharum]
MLTVHSDRELATCAASAAAPVTVSSKPVGQSLTHSQLLNSSHRRRCCSSGCHRASPSPFVRCIIAATTAAASPIPHPLSARSHNSHQVNLGKNKNCLYKAFSVRISASI